MRPLALALLITACDTGAKPEPAKEPAKEVAKEAPKATDLEVHAARKAANGIGNSAEQYRDIHSKCPVDVGTLVDFGVDPKDAVDPWGKNIEIRCTPGEKHIDAFSVGPDGEAGTADDIQRSR